eukprot:4744385-Lingulodinium_polyedra.AAC.1
MAFAQVWAAVVNKSNEPIDIDVAQRGFEVRRVQKLSFAGPSAVVAILYFSKANRTLQQQSARQDLQNVKWMGDEKVEDFFRTYRHS